MILGQVPYEIARPTGVCAASGAPIGPGAEYMAVLVEVGDDEALRREDYSIQAWAGGARPAPPGRVFSAWRTRMPDPRRARRTRIDDATLADLFEQLSEGDDQRRRTLRYLLALMLVRRKRLRYEGTRLPGDAPAPGAGQVSRGVLLVRWADAAQAGAPLEVPDPGLDEAAIAAASEELEALLAGDHDAEPSAPAPAPGAAP